MISWVAPLSVRDQPSELEVGEPTLVGGDPDHRASQSAETPAVEPRPRSDWRPLPATIGRFTILRELGLGGMGHVYVGRDEQLQREVAIKVVRAERISERSRARLHREAQALAQLAHPNVVPVFEVGEHEDQTYLAMELVVGVNIRRWLRDRPRTWQQILAVFIQAGRGLAAAHARGLVHRDFKPENAMIGERPLGVGDDADGIDAVGRVRVVDFGLVVDGEHTFSDDAIEASVPIGDLLRTQTHEVLGTPGYMAPEQLERGTIGAAADQFALCVALFEALTRNRPFAGSSAQEIATSVLAGVPIPLPRGPYSPALADVLRRGLARRPEDRWPSMAALVDQLAAVRARPQTRRRRIVALAVLASILGAGVWWWSSQPLTMGSSIESPQPGEPAAALAEPSTPIPAVAAFELHGPPGDEQARASEPFAQGMAAAARGEHDHAARLLGKAASAFEHSFLHGEDLARIELERAVEHRGAYLAGGSKYDLIIAFELLVRSSYNHYGHPRPIEIIPRAVELMQELRAHPQRPTPAGVMLDLSHRYHLMFIDAHPPGTEVLGDGELICREPCTIPTRMDEGILVVFRREGFHEGMSMMRPPSLDWQVNPLPLVRLAPGETATPIVMPH
jgi:serine/threonine protein kinase